jgi:hypothetical protein
MAPLDEIILRFGISRCDIHGNTAQECNQKYRQLSCVGNLHRGLLLHHRERFVLLYAVIRSSPLSYSIADKQEFFRGRSIPAQGLSGPTDSGLFKTGISPQFNKSVI